MGMSQERGEHPGPSVVLSRRRLLGAAVAAGAGLAAGGLTLAGGCSNRSRTSLLDKPNFLIILTDQTRVPGMHWPDGLAESILPSYARLAAHGLTFHQAHCSAAACSPSRACLFTGAYENLNGIQTVASLVTGEQLRPASELPNLATMLKSVGYEVVYKGKWDMSQPWEVPQMSFDEAEIAKLPQVMEETYGFVGWNPPDSGLSLGLPIDETPSDWSLSTLGNAVPDNDARYVHGADPEKVCPPDQTPGTGCQTPGFGESVLEYLERVGSTPDDERKPFCLVVSLTNPHDIGYYPNGYDTTGGGYPSEVANLGVGLPDNFDDPLTTKPRIQTVFREIVETEQLTDQQRIDYVNFYPALQQNVDRLIMDVLDGLDENGLTKSTIIFRTADHGEYGLSHGLIEKQYTAYREAINVPLIISNPVLFPEPRETDALWTHVDLTATIGELAGADRIGVGVSQVPVINDPRTSVRESSVFAMDDTLGSGSAVAELLTSPASHIRALIRARYTYAVYFTATYAGTPGDSSFSAGAPYQLELYDKQQDLGELNNLLCSRAASIVPLWRELHAELTHSMEAMGTKPSGWPETIEEIMQDVLECPSSSSSVKT
jgi:choline-sulfatase